MNPNRGKFEKGMTPWNKGVPMRASTWEKIKHTTFQPGNAPHTTVPLGTRRINKDGSIEIKVEGDDPQRPARGRWVTMQRWLWEKVSGPVPMGHVLKCIDGNPKNYSPKNWLCIHRGVNARLQRMGFEDADAEIKPTLIARALLAQRIGEIEPTAAQRHIARKKSRAQSRGE
jgi:hypothetical protein